MEDDAFAKPENQPSGPLVEGRDYELDPETGLLVLTRDYLLRRGYCCGNRCRNCPYGWEKVPPQDG